MKVEHSIHGVCKDHSTWICGQRIILLARWQKNFKKKEIKKKKERKNQNKKFKYYEKNFNDRKSIFINHILLKKKIKENKKKQQIDKKIFVKLLKFIKYSIKYLFIVV